MKKCLTMLLAAIMCLSMSSMAVTAATTDDSVSNSASESTDTSWPIPEGQTPSDAPSVEIPATIVLKGDLPSPDEDYVIELTADNENYPMPIDVDKEVVVLNDDLSEASNEEMESVLPSYRLTITGANTKTFPPIVFEQVGIYTYTVKQIPGDNSDCTYDETIYHLKITIYNSQNKDGLYAVTKVYTEDEPEVKKELTFTNIYSSVSSPSSSTPGTSRDDNDDDDNDESIVESSDSEEPPVKGDNASPNTGDSSKVGLYTFLFVSSAAILLAILAYERKRSVQK